MKKRGKYYQRGEVLTLLTIGTVVVLSLATITSSIFLGKNNKQTIKSKAEEKVWPKCAAGVSDKSTCSVNDYGKWCYICSPNTEPACQSQSLLNATIGAPFLCDKIGSGYQWVKKNDGECTKSCYEGVVSAASGGQSSPAAAGTASSPTSGGGTQNNGCFRLSAEIEPREENGKVAFYAWVSFESSTAGDVELLENGNHVAGWNAFGGGRFTYDPHWTQHWPPPGNWAAVSAPDKGQTVMINYEGFVRNCNPQSQTITCTLEALANGQGKVSGTGCNCKGGSANCIGPGGAAAAAAPAAPTTAPAAPAAAAGQTTPAAATTPGASGGAASPAPTKTPCERKNGTCVTFQEKKSLYLSDVYRCETNICGGSTPYCCYLKSDGAAVQSDQDTCEDDNGIIYSVGRSFLQRITNPGLHNGVMVTATGCWKFTCSLTNNGDPVEFSLSQCEQQATVPPAAPATVCNNDCCFENSDRYKTKKAVHLAQGQKTCAQLNDNSWAIVECAEKDTYTAKVCEQGCKTESQMCNSCDKKDCVNKKASGETVSYYVDENGQEYGNENCDSLIDINRFCPAAQTELPPASSSEFGTVYVKNIDLGLPEGISYEEIHNDLKFYVRVYSPDFTDCNNKIGRLKTTTEGTIENNQMIANGILKYEDEGVEGRGQRCKTSLDYYLTFVSSSLSLLYESKKVKFNALSDEELTMPGLPRLELSKFISRVDFQFRNQMDGPLTINEVSFLYDSAEVNLEASPTQKTKSIEVNKMIKAHAESSIVTSYYIGNNNSESISNFSVLLVANGETMFLTERNVKSEKENGVWILTFH